MPDPAPASWRRAFAAWLLACASIFAGPVTARAQAGCPAPGVVAPASGDPGAPDGTHQAGGPTGAAELPAPVVDRRLDEQVLRLSLPGRPDVELETTVYRPEGEGPFPLLVINHGKSPGPPRMQPRARYEWAARAFLRRGWAVALPMRQGFAGSGGRHGALVGCDFEALGRAQAADVRAAIERLAALPWVDASRIVVAGQSYGGFATLAYGLDPHPGVRALLSFAGGVRHPRCDSDAEVARAYAAWGRAVRLPTLWFYGDNDSLWPRPAWQRMHAAWTGSGGDARLEAIGEFATGDAHDLLASGAGVRVWLPPVERLLRSLGLPAEPVRTLTGARLPESAPGRPRPDDPGAWPAQGPKARIAYRAFLAAEPPRAFATGPAGAFAWAAGGRAPERAALASCQRLASARCRLRVVDDQWLADDPVPAATSASVLVHDRCRPGD